MIVDTAKGMCASVFLIGVTAGTAVLLSRSLGPDGRAAFEAATFLPRLLTPIVQLGVGEANTYFQSREDVPFDHLLANTFVLSLMLGLLTAIICLPLLPLWLHYYDSTVLALASVFLFTIPLGIFSGGLLGLTRGQRRFTAFNVLRVLAPTLEMIVIGALFVTGRLTLVSISIVHLTVAFAWLAVQLAILWRPGMLSARPDLASLKRMLRYGASCQTAMVAEVANGSVDRALLVTLLRPADFGQFVVATRVASLLLYLPHAVGNVLLPESARRSGPQAVRLTLYAVGVNAAIMAVLGTGLFLTVPFLIPLVFGEAFAPAVLPAQILIVGLAADGLASILDQALKGMGRPLYSAAANWLGAAVTVGGILWLVPTSGLTAAAGSSAAGYALSFAVLFVFFWRMRTRLLVSVPA